MKCLLLEDNRLSSSLWLEHHPWQRLKGEQTNNKGNLKNYDDVRALNLQIFYNEAVCRSGESFLSFCLVYPWSSIFKASFLVFQKRNKSIEPSSTWRWRGDNRIKELACYHGYSWSENPNVCFPHICCNTPCSATDIGELLEEWGWTLWESNT